MGKKYSVSQCVAPKTAVPAEPHQSAIEQRDSRPSLHLGSLSLCGVCVGCVHVCLRACGSLGRQTYRTVTLFQLDLSATELWYLPVSTPQPPVLKLQGLTAKRDLLYCVWVIEIRTQVLMLTNQTFYPLSYPPIPNIPFERPRTVPSQGPF